MSKKIKLPKKIKIFNLDYRIRWASSYAAFAADACGWLDIQRQTLFLRREYASEQQLRDTVLHEIIHALNAVLNLTDEREHVLRTDEAIATRLASGILTVMRDNPEIRKWIFKKD